MDDHQVQMSVQLGRIEERLIAVSASLTKHMVEEHQSFDVALGKVEKLEHAVAEIHNAARISKALLGVLAVIGGGLAWMFDWIRLKH